MEKLPITAVIVSYNEGKLLDNCLKSVQFCKEIIVINLESTDNTEEIARKNNAKVIQHKRVPIVEIIHHWIQDKIENKWMLITDPDEETTSQLEVSIRKAFKSIPQNIGCIRVPWQFYFKNKKLQGTPWGGIQNRVYLVNTDNFYFIQDVHIGRHLKDGFKEIILSYDKSNFLKHFWMQGYTQLFKKHHRYLLKEGSARHNKGERTRLKMILFEPLKSFKYAFWKCNGRLDGITGLFLSFFWAYYQTLALISLYIYQRKHDLNHPPNL